jgi:hypothetical protein
MRTSRMARGMVGLLMLLTLLVAGGCSSTKTGPAEVSVSRKIYVDAESMAGDSSAIVAGRLGEVIGRAVDDGGSSEAQVKVPTILYDFRVASRSKGSSNTPKNITIAWADAGEMKSDDLVPLQSGKEYLFFLEKLARTDRGGLQDYGTLYVPVSGIAGVFDLEDEQAVATDVELKKVKKSEADRKRRSGRMVVAPAELLALSPGRAK